MAQIIASTKEISNKRESLIVSVSYTHLADQVDEVLMGCVIQAGLGQNVARQASINAGLPCLLYTSSG